MEEKYNEAFSWSHASLGDVIIRFSHKFHSISKVYKIENDDCVDVSAGVQICDLNVALEKKGCGLETAPMIRYVTAVGLSATSGHGTGQNKFGFSGQNLKLKYHLGKVLPDPSLTYRDIYGEEVIENMINLLCRWYKVERPQLAKIPFLTSFILKNLGLMPGDVIAENLHVEANRSAVQKKPEIAEAYNALVQDEKVYANKLCHHNEGLRQDWVNACHEFTNQIRESEPYVDIALGHSMKMPGQ